MCEAVHLSEQLGLQGSTAVIGKIIGSYQRGRHDVSSGGVFLHFNKKDLTRFTLQVCKCYTWSPWCCFLELVRIPQSILRIICMGEIKRIFLMRFKRYADISGGGLKWEAKTITIHPRVVLLADVGKNPPGPLQLMMRETSAFDTGGLCPTNDLGCVSTSLFLCYRLRFTVWQSRNVWRREQLLAFVSFGLLLVNSALSSLQMITDLQTHFHHQICAVT